jgi:hypothetical protein
MPMDTRSALIEVASAVARGAVRRSAAGDRHA